MGESARKPGAPTLPKTPLEVLDSDIGRGFTPAYKLAYPITGALVGIGGVFVHNTYRRRPFWSGIPAYVISVAVLTYAGIKVRDWKFADYMEKDAIVKHYVTLHPEDFPPFERTRYKDLFLPWTPIR